MNRSVRFGVLLGIYWLCSHAVATTPICFTSLQFLATSQSENPQELIRATYLELWRTLAAAKLDAKQAKALLDETDPWAAPKNGGDFAALERRLAEFGELLDKKGWRTAEVTKELGRARRELLEEIIGVDRRLQQVVQRTGDNRAQDIALPGAETGVVTPDGSFVYTALPDGAKTKLFAYDTLGNHTTSLEVEEKGLRGPYLLPDGSGLVLLKEGKPSLLFVPLKNGVPVKDAITTLAKPPTLLQRWFPSSAVPVDAAVGGSNHLIVGRYANPAGYFLFDRRAGTVTPLQVPVKAGETVLKWGFIPGTDELYFLAASRGVGQTTGFQKFVLLRETLPNPYVRNAPGKSWEWLAGTDSNADSVHFAWRDGGADAVFGFNLTRTGTGRTEGVLQTLSFPPPSWKPTLPLLVTSSVEIGMKIQSMTAPVSDKSVVITTPSDQPGLNQVLSIDPAAPEKLKRGPRVPHHPAFRLSPSPDKVFVFGKSGAVQWVWDEPSRPVP